jgi:23S rRNA (uracil1939-C5)-methyltransferase
VQTKNAAIKEFWDSLEIGIPIEPIVPSPLGRNYRTVSKRKFFVSRDKYVLGLIGVDDESNKSFAMNIAECVIEPKEHNEIYQKIQTYLQLPQKNDMGAMFNYVIVKGISELSIIFNVNDNSSFARKELNQLSKYLTKHISKISNVFVFVDEERSRYYLSSGSKQSGKIILQKIFGKAKIFHAALGKKFLHSPLSFSQTNHSILEEFISSAAQMLDLQSNDTLYDLYCGYGLFSLCLSGKVHEAIGIELSHQSIEDAKENAVRNKIANARFYSANISEESLPRFFKQHKQHTKILLDPPRNGTSEEVIEFLAAEEPERVVHIFCNSAIIGKELTRWKNSGYSIVKAVPFDMFPGTNEIEVMVELKK